MSIVRFKKPKKFIVCIDRFDALGERVWALGIGNEWVMVKKIKVNVKTETIFKGAKARQPKAYMTGYCKRLELDHDTLVVD